jgi:hypothetical protein
MITRPKRPAPHNRSVTPLTSFPVELLYSILGFVVESTLQSITKESLPCILRQYRALLRTCRLFKLILENDSLQIFVQNWHNATTKGPRTFVVNYNARHITESTGYRTNVLTNWPSVFKAIQKLVLRQTKLYYVQRYAGTFGKFWLNPMVTFNDIELNYDAPVNLDLIICLRPIFHRDKRPLTEKEREEVPNLPRPYSIGKVVNIIPKARNRIHLCSVLTWGMESNHQPRPNWTNTMSGSNDAKQVSEWWIWRDSRVYPAKTYIFGYHKKNAWLIDLQSRKVYKNPPERPLWRY